MTSPAIATAEAATRRRQAAELARAALYAPGAWPVHVSDRDRVAAELAAACEAEAAAWGAVITGPTIEA
jgi:hypothetical protein